MEAGILIISCSETLDSIASHLPASWKPTVLDDRLVLERGSSHCIIARSDSVSKTLEAGEIQRIEREIQGPTYYVFEFNDGAFGREVMTSIVRSVRLLFDDDHDGLWSGEEALKSPVWNHV